MSNETAAITDEERANVIGKRGSLQGDDPKAVSIIDEGDRILVSVSASPESKEAARRAETLVATAGLSSESVRGGLLDAADSQIQEAEAEEGAGQGSSRARSRKGKDADHDEVGFGAPGLGGQDNEIVGNVREQSSEKSSVDNSPVEERQRVGLGERFRTFMGLGDSNKDTSDAQASAGEQPTRLWPADFDKRYRQDGARVIRTTGDKDQVVLHDLGDRLRSADRDVDVSTIKLMVATAQTRGWDEVTVKGTPEFRKAAWTAAQEAGITVKGYSPEKQEQHRVDRMQQQKQQSRSDAADSFANARSSGERKAAVAKHPELAQAFALEHALSKKLDGHKGVEGFARDAVRDRIVKTIREGGKLPEVQTRWRDQYRYRDTVQEKNRSSNRDR